MEVSNGQQVAVTRKKKKQILVLGTGFTVQICTGLSA